MRPSGIRRFNSLAINHANIKKARAAKGFTRSAIVIEFIRQVYSPPRAGFRHF